MGCLVLGQPISGKLRINMRIWMAKYNSEFNKFSYQSIRKKKLFYFPPLKINKHLIELLQTHHQQYQ